MYSRKIVSVLKRDNIKIGQKVRIKKDGRIYEGLLLPRPDSGDPNCLVIKLDNGYNIGIRFDKKTIIEKIEMGHEDELGKTDESILKVSFDSKKPPISLIATGGTVASRIDYRTGGVTGLMEPKEFLYNIPELADIVNIKRIERPFTKMSEDMDYRDWQKLAILVSKELNSEKVGVIITHGTDSLHFTSAALSFMLRGLTKPVVLMGSQKSSDRGSSDAGMNLVCSAYIAVSDIAEVGICMHGTMNDDYCYFIRGVKARKMHTVRRDAFRPINDLPIAKIWQNGMLEIINKNFRKRKDGEVKPDIRFEPKIALVKIYPGSEPEILDFLREKGYKGFVLEAMGLGHVPTKAKKSWIPFIKRCIKDGVPVIVTSQTLYGRINPRVYTNLRILFSQAGAIPGEDMLPEVAYIKLGWVMGKVKELDKVRAMMLKNIAGEITSRSLLNTYLY